MKNKVKNVAIVGIIFICFFALIFSIVFITTVRIKSSVKTEYSDEEIVKKKLSDEEIVKKKLSVTIYSNDYYSNDMHYKMFYTTNGDPFVVNLTKDSLECEYYRNKENIEKN